MEVRSLRYTSSSKVVYFCSSLKLRGHQYYVLSNIIPILRHIMSFVIIYRRNCTFTYQKTLRCAVADVNNVVHCIIHVIQLLDNSS